MQALDQTSGGANLVSESVALRLLRSLSLTILGGIFALIVATACVWLLAHVLIGIAHARAQGLAWGLGDVAGCGAVILALTFLACLAIGHIALMWISGWRGSRS